MKERNFKEIYLERSKLFESKAKKEASLHFKWSIFRLFLFIGAVGVFILLGNWNYFAGFAFVFFFLIGFSHFLKRHHKIFLKQKHFENLTLINDNEIKAINGDSRAFFDGEKYLDPSHPYAIDLDIFGKSSLYQFINRTNSILGANRLAHFFLNLEKKNVIEKRQSAISELKDKLDWRQNFQAGGIEIEDKEYVIDNLKNWTKGENLVLGNKIMLIQMILFHIIGIIGLFAIYFYLPIGSILLFYIPVAWLMKNTVPKVSKIAKESGESKKTLNNYAKYIKHIELGKFQDKHLLSLQNEFKGGVHASEALQKFSYSLTQLNVRSNPFAIILNLLGSWDLWWVYSIEKWRKENGNRLNIWLESMAEFEVLNSFGNLYHNNPDWSLPLLTTQTKIEFDKVGHPLIPITKRISNSIHIPTKGHIKLLTGSNMAGKSTFLRTIGINMVLAQIGSPVCAKKIILPNMDVYTSMRTQDDLSEQTSSFFAELKRLKVIIEAVEKDENSFFLLDEILKGTNSKDRHTGSRALIQQLIKSKGAGIIATHDLELAVLEQEYDGALINVCMEVDVDGKELIFDYTLKPGVCKSFNATHLMKNMGIKID